MSKAIVTLDGNKVAALSKADVQALDAAFGTKAETHVARLAIIADLTNRGYSVRGIVYAVAKAYGNGTVPEGLGKSNVGRYAAIAKATTRDEAPNLTTEETAEVIAGLYSVVKAANVATLNGVVDEAYKARTGAGVVRIVKAHAAKANGAHNAAEAQALLDGGQRAVGGTAATVESEEEHEESEAASESREAGEKVSETVAIARIGTGALIAELTRRYSVKSATVLSTDAEALTALVQAVENLIETGKVAKG